MSVKIPAIGVALAGVVGCLGYLIIGVVRNKRRA